MTAHSRHVSGKRVVTTPSRRGRLRLLRDCAQWAMFKNAVLLAQRLILPRTQRGVSLSSGRELAATQSGDSAKLAAARAGGSGLMGRSIGNPTPSSSTSTAYTALCVRRSRGSFRSSLFALQQPNGMVPGV